MRTSRTVFHVGLWQTARIIGSVITLLDLAAAATIDRGRK